MPPSILQGLNIVHPPPPPSPSQDLLFPDLTSHLDLWTNLAFASDEPLLRNHDDPISLKKQLVHHQDNDDPDDDADDLDTDDSTSQDHSAAKHDSHVNVVTGDVLLAHQHPETQALAQSTSFDINSFLAGFGIDPFALPAQPQPQPPPPPQPQPQPVVAGPSIAQLLALHSAAPRVFHPPPPIQPILSPIQQNGTAADNDPPSKRSRKSSVSTIDSSGDYPDTSPAAPASASSPPLSPAEDKRRRNTAASARFRMKKKEREAALESKAKELEGKVSELERECEGLRRENGWLKGLVVGVTGAAAQPQPSPQNQVQPAAQVGAGGSKRSREEEAGTSKS